LSNPDLIIAILRELPKELPRKLAREAFRKSFQQDVQNSFELLALQSFGLV
jgi:hypothetical protein